MLLTVSLLFLISACKKQSHSEQVEFIPENAPLTIQGQDGISVTASDVYSKKSSFRREIIVNNANTESQVLKAYVTFISDNSENIYSQLKSKRNEVSGTFTIETEGQVIYKKRIINGIEQKGEKVALNLASKALPVVPCTVTTVHDCVSWKIDDMNWIDYTLCLASAPGCYAGLWASCTWDVCKRGIKYENPF